MTRIAIIAALPGELKPLVRGWQHERRNGVDSGRPDRNNAEWIAACAGMGQRCSHARFCRIEEEWPH